MAADRAQREAGGGGGGGHGLRAPARRFRGRLRRPVQLRGRARHRRGEVPVRGYRGQQLRPLQGSHARRPVPEAGARPGSRGAQAPSPRVREAPPRRGGALHLHAAVAPHRRPQRQGAGLDHHSLALPEPAARRGVAGRIAAAPSAGLLTSAACHRGGWRRGRGAIRRSGTPEACAPPAGRRFRRGGDGAGAPPAPDDGPRLAYRLFVRLGPAARIDAGRLHAIEDAVELVAAILVRGPDGVERFELGEIAEAAVGRLGHGPLPAPVPAESLPGLDPEALRRLVVKVARTLAGRHGSKEEAGGEADRARGWRDEVREVAEGPEIEIPLALGEEGGERRPLRHMRVAHRLDAGEGFRSAHTHRSSRRVARGKHSCLLEELASRRDPVSEGGSAVHRGQEAFRIRRCEAAAPGAHLGRAVLRIHLASREGVEAAEKAHALLAADHVDLGRRGDTGANEENGGGRPGGDRGHGAEARERRSSASCSIRASADTGLATTRSTNWLPSWAATLSPQPVRRNTGVSGESDFTRSATSQPFIRGMPRSVMTTSCWPGSKIRSASSPLTAVVTACPQACRVSESTERRRGSSSTRRMREACSGCTGSTTPSTGGMIWNRLAWRRSRTTVPRPGSLSMLRLPP